MTQALYAHMNNKIKKNFIKNPLLMVLVLVKKKENATLKTSFSKILPICFGLFQYH
jgi:hypothetical protein